MRESMASKRNREINEGIIGGLHSESNGGINGEQKESGYRASKKGRHWCRVPRYHFALKQTTVRVA